MKKQRGVYRKLNLLLKKLDLFEPIKKNNMYEKFVVPSNNFFNISPNNIKRKFIIKLLEITEKLINNKDNRRFCRIVGMIETKEISNSKIIVFYN